MGELGPVIGRILISLLITAAAAIGINTAYSKLKVGWTQEDLVVLRMQVQQLFIGTNYSGLSNEVALNSDVVPQGFVKDGAIKNAWGGDITLTGDASNGTFDIELANIPKSACTQLASFQSEAWEGIHVNGTPVGVDDVAGIANACGETNTITYTVR